MCCTKVQTKNNSHKIKNSYFFHIFKTHDCSRLILKSQNRGCLTGGGVPIFFGTSFVGLVRPVGMFDGVWGHRHVNQLFK